MKAFRFTGKIAVPGAYVGVPMATYHDGPCDGFSVSSSSIRRFMRSPEHYWATSPFNPERAERPDTAAMAIGRAAHCLAFELDAFGRHFAVRPEEWKDYRTKEAQLWKETVIADGKTPLTPEDMTTVQAMVERLRAEPEAVALFRHGLPELTLAAKDEATGIWLLSRPDYIPASPARGPVDYKTTNDAAPEKWSRSAFDFGYHIQAALMIETIKAITGVEREFVWMVVQETSAPYSVVTMRWEPEQIAYGRRRLRDALDRMARCIERQEWPGYPSPSSVVTPFYIRKDIEENGQ